MMRRGVRMGMIELSKDDDDHYFKSQVKIERDIIFKVTT